MVKKYSLCVLIICLICCSASATTFNVSKLQTIPVELSSHLGDLQQFVEGEEIQFLLSLGSDAYIYMFYIDAVNNIKQILPSENQQSNFYAAGYYQTIPEYDNGYRFIINKPFGEESIWIFASDQSISLNKNHGSISSIKEKIRQESRQAYGEYTLKITTRKR